MDEKMAAEDTPDDPYRITVEGMRGWLKREIEDVTKAAELRIAEATGFVEGYAQAK
jgi:hypothetical protein